MPSTKAGGPLTLGRRQCESALDSLDYFSLGVENEWADAGRDGQTHLARPNFQAREYGGFINGRRRGTREESRK